MRKVSALFGALIVLSSLIIIIIPHYSSAVNAESGASIPMRLYWHSGDAPNMNPKAPTEPGANATTVRLNNGDSKTFETRALEKSMTIDTKEICNVSFWLTIKVNNTALTGIDYVTVNLTFLLEDTIPRASGIWSHTTAGMPIGHVTTQLSFIAGWPGIVSIGSVLKLKISSQASVSNGEDNTQIQKFNLATYDITATYDSKDHPSCLSFWCAPLTATISTHDNTTGVQKVEFEPNVLPAKASILFKGSIQNAFGSDDVVSVDLKITGTGVSEAINLTSAKGTKTGSYEYAWNYSKYSKSLVPDSIYIANLTVRVAQHTFYRATNFTFSPYGVYCTIDKKETEFVRPDETGGCSIEITNTGGATDTLDVSIEQYPSPSDKRWNISYGLPPTLTLSPGVKHEFKLYATPPAGATNGSCKIIITATSGGNRSKMDDVEFRVEIVKPWEVNLDWRLSYTQPFLVVSGYTYKFSIKVTNRGGNNDVFNLTVTKPLDWTDWDISLDKYTLALDRWRGTRYYDYVNLTVIPKDSGVPGNMINITGESQGAALHGEGIRYSNISLRLQRVQGIELSADSYSKEVDVKISDAQASYTITISTNDDTTHTVTLEIYDKDARIKSVLIDGSSTATVTVARLTPRQVTLSIGMKRGTTAGSYKVNVRATIQGQELYTKSLPNPIAVVVRPYYAAELKCDNQTAITATSYSGSTIEYTLKLKNAGNANTTFDLRVKDGLQFNPTVYPEAILVKEGSIENARLVLIIPKGARRGDTIFVSIEARHEGNVLATLTFTIKVEKSDLEVLTETLYQMSHFIILLIAVIVVFVALWIRRGKAG